MAEKGATKKKTLSKDVKKQVKFEDPYKVANKFVDIISPTFGLTKGVKLIVKARLKLAKKDELRQCMLDVLRLLVSEYKK